MKPEQDIEKIAENIQKYLFDHPNAADTLEGITRWWLQRLRFEETIDKVQKALEYLINRNYVLKTKNSEGSTIYKSFERESKHLEEH